MARGLDLEMLLAAEAYGPRGGEKARGVSAIKIASDRPCARNARVTASLCLLSSRRDRCPCMCASTPSTHKRYLPCFRLCPPCFQSTPYQPSQKREASFATDGLIIAGMLLAMAAMVVVWPICMRLFHLPDWFVISLFL